MEVADIIKLLQLGIGGFLIIIQKYSQDLLVVEQQRDEPRSNVLNAIKRHTNSGILMGVLVLISSGASTYFSNATSQEMKSQYDKKLSALQNIYTTAMATNTDLKIEIVKTESQLGYYEKAFKDTLTSKQELTELYNKTLLQTATLSSDLKQAQLLASQVEDQKKHAVEDANLAKSKVEGMQSRYEDLLKEKITLSIQVATTSVRLTELESKLPASEREIAELRAKSKSMETEKSGCLDRITALTEDLKKQKQYLDQKGQEITSLTSVNNKQARDIVGLKEQYNALSKQLEVTDSERFVKKFYDSINQMIAGDDNAKYIVWDTLATSRQNFNIQKYPNLQLPRDYPQLWDGTQPHNLIFVKETGTSRAETFVEVVFFVEEWLLPNGVDVWMRGDEGSSVQEFFEKYKTADSLASCIIDKMQKDYTIPSDQLEMLKQEFLKAKFREIFDPRKTVDIAHSHGFKRIHPTTGSFATDGLEKYRSFDVRTIKVGPEVVQGTTKMKIFENAIKVHSFLKK